MSDNTKPVCCIANKGCHKKINKKMRQKLRSLLKKLSAEDINEFENYKLHFVIRTHQDPGEMYGKCKYLLDNKVCDVNARNEARRTALHYLLRYHNLEICSKYKRIFDLLIANGADVNCRDETGITPLSECIHRGYYQLMETLLKLGANPNKTRSDDFSPLLVSVYKENENYAKLLMDFGAHASELEAVLQATSKRDRAGILQMMIERSPTFVSDVNRQALQWNSREFYTIMLHQAIQDEAANSVEVLLENGISLEVYNKSFSKPCILSRVYAKYQASREETPDSETHRRYEVMLRNVIKHIAVLMGNRKTGISESTLNLLKNDKLIKAEYKRYSNQVRLMRKSLVHEDLDVTYYHLMKKCGKKLVECCSDEVISAISREKIYKMFPDFAQKLRRRVRVGISQRTDRKDYLQMLYGILNTRLPLDLAYCICDFLKTSDMNETWLKVLDLRIN